MFAAVMRLLLKCLRLGRRRRFKLVREVEQLWHYGHLCLRSLLYNSFTNGDVVLDSLFEPVYWLVDHVTRWFGVVSHPHWAGYTWCWGKCASGAMGSGLPVLRAGSERTSVCGSDRFPLALSCLCLSPGTEELALPTSVTQAPFL